MGFLPTRDTALLLPDVAEDLAADLALARLAVGHEPLVGREDGDPHAAEHAGHLGCRRVDAEARLRDPAQTGDRPPEPYKGKGIRYEGEYVRRKVGKRA